MLFDWKALHRLGGSTLVQHLWCTPWIFWAKSPRSRWWTRNYKIAIPPGAPRFALFAKRGIPRVVPQDSSPRLSADTRNLHRHTAARGLHRISTNATFSREHEKQQEDRHPPSRLCEACPLPPRIVRLKARRLTQRSIVQLSR